MNNIAVYDIMVVYSSSIAKSAGDRQYKEKSPFSTKGRYEIYNDSYRYFLLECKKMRMRVAFTTSEDIIGSGLFKSFWTYHKGWVRHYGKASSQLIFDKYNPNSSEQKKRLQLLVSSGSVYLFNNEKIRHIFQNKLHTYEHFKKFAIPTVHMDNLSARTVALAKKKLDKLLKKHPYNNDFHDGYIVKDKGGAGGFNIFKMSFDKAGLEAHAQRYESSKKRKRILSYILQPFIKCDKGFTFGKYEGLIDLRIIILNRTIIQTYIRIAKKGNFKCNEHQGGNLVYLPLEVIPKGVLAMAGEIVKRLATHLDLEHSLYASDFIRSNNGNVYFIEGNTNPGIDWNHKKRKNEIKSKELITYIVRELKLLFQERSARRSLAYIAQTI